MLVATTQVAPPPSQGQEPLLELSIPAGVDFRVVADHITISSDRPGEILLEGYVTIEWAKGPGQIVGQGIVREFFPLQMHAARVTVVQQDRQSPSRILADPRPDAPLELWVPAGLTMAFGANKVAITGAPGAAKAVFEGNVRIGFAAKGDQHPTSRVELRAPQARVTSESKDQSGGLHLLIEPIPSSPTKK